MVQARIATWQYCQRKKSELSKLGNLICHSLKSELIHVKIATYWQRCKGVKLETTLIICLWNLSMSCLSVCLSGSPNYGAGLFWVQLLVRPQTLNACNSLVVARFNALNLVEAFVVRIMMRLMAMVAMPMISLFLAFTQWHVSNPVEAPFSCILQHILSTFFIIKIMV